MATTSAETVANASLARAIVNDSQWCDWRHAREYSGQGRLVSVGLAHEYVDCPHIATHSSIYRTPPGIALALDFSQAKKKASVLKRWPFDFGAAGRIRTHDPLVRSQVLYPTELQPLKDCDYSMSF